MHRDVYDVLVTKAKAGKTVTYGEIAPMVGLDMALADDRNQMADILREIALHEHEAGHPLLTAVVVHAQDPCEPGPGFFKLAKELNLMQGSGQSAYFWAELQRVFEYWQGETES